MLEFDFIDDITIPSLPSGMWEGSLALAGDAGDGG